MLMFIGFVLVAAIVYNVGSHTEGAASMGVLVTHFQLVGSFCRFNINWPCEFKEWSDWLLDVFSFKIDSLARPECSIKLQPFTAFVFKLSMPAAFLLSFVAWFWFNRVLRPKLRGAGWVCVRDGGDTYWSWRRYEYRPR